MVGETGGEPRVVFNESVTRTDTPVTAEDGALGPFGGIGLATLAVVLTAFVRGRLATDRLRSRTRQSRAERQR